mmetsp:Transcript_4756/g.10299  ORF Transcript_4756/g.10299 Transcript_4756/m.10299 type:complete len:81 (+) Transcript_4756:176-418(+)
MECGVRRRRSDESETRDGRWGRNEQGATKLTVARRLGVSVGVELDVGCWMLDGGRLKRKLRNWRRNEWHSIIDYCIGDWS